MNKAIVREKLIILFTSQSVDAWLEKFPFGHIFHENYVSDFIDYINSLGV
jgi:hypothetical protein